MVRIGVTGLMASGKSTVARRFEERGAVRIDGDTLGWETLRLPEVRDRIAALFGPSVIGRDGEVDRAELGAKVFRDRPAMGRLNAIVQPPLLSRVRDRLASAGSVAVVDAALLSTWGLERELDGVVEVVAPEAVRIARLKSSRGFTEAEATERIRGQSLPPLHGVRRHWRLENDGDAKALLGRADQIWNEIESLTAERRP